MVHLGDFQRAQVKNRSPEAMLNMFRAGLDTFDIALRLNLREDVVSRHIWVARCREMGVQALYVGRIGNTAKAIQLNAK